MKMNENECFVKSMVGVIQKLETKVGAKLFRGNTKALDKWRNLAGEEAMNGVIVANIERPLNEIAGFVKPKRKHPNPFFKSYKSILPLKFEKCVLSVAAV
jgi:hypothetical protein